MKKFASFLKWFIGLSFVIVLAVTACYVAVFALEKDSMDKIYLYNFAFVAEKEDDGMNMWFVKKTAINKLNTGDGVVYFSDNGYHAANYDGDEDQKTFFRADNLNEPVTVTNENCVGRIIAAW